MASSYRIIRGIVFASYRIFLAKQTCTAWLACCFSFDGRNFLPSALKITTLVLWNASRNCSHALYNASISGRKGSLLGSIILRSTTNVAVFQISFCLWKISQIFSLSCSWCPSTTVKMRVAACVSVSAAAGAWLLPQAGSDIAGRYSRRPGLDPAVRSGRLVWRRHQRPRPRPPRSRRGWCHRWSRRLRRPGRGHFQGRKVAELSSLEWNNEK